MSYIWYSYRAILVAPETNDRESGALSHSEVVVTFLHILCICMKMLMVSKCNFEGASRFKAL